MCTRVQALWRYSKPAQFAHKLSWEAAKKSMKGLHGGLRWITQSLSCWSNLCLRNLKPPALKRAKLKRLQNGQHSDIYWGCLLRQHQQHAFYWCCKIRQDGDVLELHGIFHHSCSVLLSFDLQSQRQVWETSVEYKWETNVNSCAPRHPEWETRVGDAWETSVKSCGPRHPSVRDKWETSVGDKCGRQVWETSVGDKWKLMRPKPPRVGDKGETSVNSCSPRHPEWETRVGDEWEISVKLCGPSGPSAKLKPAK